MNGTAAGEARKSGLLLARKKIDKKGYSFFPKLTKSKLFLYFS
jgi:hypothetical protein